MSSDLQATWKDLEARHVAYATEFGQLRTELGPMAIERMSLTDGPERADLVSRIQVKQARVRALTSEWDALIDEAALVAQKLGLAKLAR
jgi:hypothetical protein